MDPNVKKLLATPNEKLDDLYRASAPGKIPVGDTLGTAIIYPGTILARLFARLMKWFFWQGKVFYPEEGFLLNKIWPWGKQDLKAKVYKDKSWLDGKETILIDYSELDGWLGTVRDEIREIEPGLFLGKVWIGEKRSLDFVLIPGKTTQDEAATLAEAVTPAEADETPG